MKAWLQLLRPPNLLTVPGDPLAGFLLASVATAKEGSIDFLVVLPCIGASLLLYMAGLLLNDFADRDEDAEWRPDRPIPAGKVSARAVLTVGMLLIAAGIALAAVAGRRPMLTAGCLAVLILLYNSVARKIRSLGSLTMGMCRGCSLLLGASVIGFESPLVLLAALGVGFYIMEVSNAAVLEAEGRLLKGVRWLPPAVLLIFFIVFHYKVGAVVPASFILSLAAFTWVLSCALALGRAKEESSRIAGEIGRLIRGLLLIQAALCLVAGRPGLMAAVGLLLLWPVAIFLSRRFYAS